MTEADAKNEIYSMLCIDLQRVNIPDGQATYYKNIIDVAITEIGREGITLDIQEDLSHRQTVEMYAAYLIRKRVAGDGMPRMLRARLNDLLFSQKMTTTDSTT